MLLKLLNIVCFELTKAEINRTNGNCLTCQRLTDFKVMENRILISINSHLEGNSIPDGFRQDFMSHAITKISTEINTFVIFFIFLKLKAGYNKFKSITDCRRVLSLK